MNSASVSFLTHEWYSVVPDFPSSFDSVSPYPRCEIWYSASLFPFPWRAEGPRVSMEVVHEVLTSECTITNGAWNGKWNTQQRPEVVNSNIQVNSSRCEQEEDWTEMDPRAYLCRWQRSVQQTPLANENTSAQCNCYFGTEVSGIKPNQSETLSLRPKQVQPLRMVGSNI